MLISNEQIFEKLFREYYSHLCNYAGRYIIDSQIREDIVQVFFISIAWMMNSDLSKLKIFLSKWDIDDNVQNTI